MNEIDTDPRMQTLISNLKRACTAPLPPSTRAQIAGTLSMAASQPPSPTSRSRLRLLLPWAKDVPLGNWRRRAIAGAACLALAGGGLSVAAAASPTVRSALGWPTRTTVGVAVSPNGSGIDGVYPNAGFDVVNAGYVPAGLTVRWFGYFPVGGPRQRGVIAGVGSGETSKPTGHAWPSNLDSLPQQGSAFAYEGFFSADAKQYVELIERPIAASSTQTGGQPFHVGTAAGTIRRDGPATALDFAKGGTDVTVRTNLGQSEAVKVAASLR
jgi:hypothetical protein